MRPEDVRDLVMSYAPNRDGRPDAGEIVWTWVPYVENDGRGKDRPVLVIARAAADRVYAVKLTSRSRDGDREFLPIGSGAWDAQGRESWVDLDQLYSVHVDGMRREAAALDRDRFSLVAGALRERYGWSGRV
jgi:mRNA-degrading endonuclease toxin of MazEF toxin-antitoxin module